MKKTKVYLLAVSSLLMTAGNVNASGFALIEQSASGLGNAYAGGAAAAEDATTVFFNPAGMVLLKGQQLVSVLHYISPAASFGKETARNVAGTSLSGGESGDAGVATPVPNIYYAARLNSDLAVGLGISTPFGLTTEYDNTWVGRYHAVKSEMMTININPSVAYKINNRFSVGAGFNAQYLKAELSSMIDFGLAAYSRLLSTGQNAQATALATAGALSNTRADIFGVLKGDSWGYGYNVGALFTPSESTRFGIAYRSQIKHSLKGDATFSPRDSSYLSALGLSATAGAMFANQTIASSITLPASLSVSAYHRINPSWAIMADASWTQWSSFDKLIINFDGSLKNSPSITTESWRDTWRLSAGASYTPMPKLVVRTGFAFDQTPVPDAEHRTPRIPDNDRYWMAIGAGYAFSDTMGADIGYAHLFVTDAKINKSSTTPEDSGRGTLVGTYKDSVDIISAQLKVNF